MQNENLVSLQPRLSSIDLLRGGAALAVVVHHALEMRNEPAYAPAWFHAIRTVLYQGYLGVPLFFVISGFCIHLRCARALSRGQEPALGFTSFWKRRIHRLYPPYFAALCLSMLTVLAGYFLHMRGATANYPDPKLRWMGFDFLAHIFMLHGVIPRFDMGAGNPPFWTLAREEYLYLLYFFVFAWRKRLGIYPALALVLFCGLAFYAASLPFVHPGSEGWLVTSTSAIVLWIQWCLGMLAVEAYYGVVKLPGWASEL
jgi:peptidoglycan/LPS O-acetylase OafA/YrhL